ncbi:PREDICTED: uncharacterized protein LOC104793407 [Camelina sativa]|uniref:Uncharacterized protein LOC104793407 n=1 Tax=Camelina sativa TaxID=90675 RepID=A0ABM0ZN15_CAMSA|nr:PREDICTED: uncharacterized protein LOC104793407 [Camelina sativa]
MRCKRHTVDFSSSIGVCASCLRERLFSLAVSTAASQTDDHHSRISPPPPLLFPRSVSPYVAPRKSDAGVDSVAVSSSNNNRFFSTPQVLEGGGGRGSTSSEKVFVSSSFKKNKKSGLSRFSSFFRPTRSDVYDSRRDSCDDASTVFSQSSTSTSRSWLSKVLSVRSKKQQSNTTTCYIEDLIAAESDHHHQNRPRQRYCRGMSPAGESTTNDDSVEESPGRLRRTPAMGTPGRRKVGFGRSVSGMAFCLSPLVRAKPSNWRGRFLPDFGYSESPANPHLSTAASFCGNRSKKLVDLGRLDHRR